ncbi:DNA replication/repair protein RecF [Wolbachia pipientis]|uniref:DNA replication and repair protein RecF n=1 Tax=Wolbachia pipientis TaxID=955 RepID=A0A1E7QJL4_WOLPI|nr:DNA replication/repair protein RecF [Wolbachia pipientis]OEY86429.1 DNA replication/repair protein RecF [Wolbachia pipientis]
MVTYCYINKLKLHNFRNYLSFELDSGGSSVVIAGNNGTGKTNILEAISLLAKSNGMKKAKTTEMQNKFANEDWVVHYNFFNGVEFNSIGIAKGYNKKLVQIDNKMQLSYLSLYKISNVIWFIPQMDHILIKSPSERLKFLDRIASMFENNYTSAYMKYRKAKYERSKLLRDGILDKLWLSSLENIMATMAIDIFHMRSSVLSLIQNVINTAVSFPKANLKITSQLNSDDTVKYYQNLLAKNREKDLLTGRVSFGVHNDNFQVFCQKRNIPINLCSTGEQKLLLLSIILSSVKARCIYYNKAPILLLDDIMSHLDEQHRKLLLEEIIHIKCQTWITDVDQDNFCHYRDFFKFFDL